MSLSKAVKKSSNKTRNWTDDETVLLCEVLSDPMNNYLNTLETKALKKAPTREVFQAILIDFNGEMLTSEFAEINAKNFTEKNPIAS